MILRVGADAGICRHAELSRGFLIGCRDRNDPRSHGQRTVGFLLTAHLLSPPVSNTQYHEASAIAIPKSEEIKEK